MKNCLNEVGKEIAKNKLVYFLLFLILSFSAFFRLYRLNTLLGFWYDQGRDALVIWDFIYHGKLFLIGPVTGIEGIFLGPFYYYLLSPFYFLGGGNPVWAAAGLSWIAVGAVFLLFYLGKKFWGYPVGLLAAFFYGFSYNQIMFSRWLANPNPLPFFALLVLLFFYRFVRGKRGSLVWAAFFLGLCLQLEAASAVFFLPSMLLILIWKRKNLSLKILLTAFLSFLVTLLPQIYFNFRHEGILVTAFKKFLIEERSFGISFGQVLRQRLLLYFDVFGSQLFPRFIVGRIVAVASFSALAIFYRKKIFSQAGKMLAIWLFVPLVGFLFYRGNHGYVWDYYFSGVVPTFILLLSAGLYFLAKSHLIGKIMVCLFLLVFGTLNIRPLKNYYQAGIGIALRAQKRAIDWIYKDAGSSDFNVDVYVPPQIPYSYSYLFCWYGKGKYGREPETKMIKNLYTLSEPDDGHPQFLKAWLERQDGIGRIEKSYFWGSITVQKRERIKYE